MRLLDGEGLCLPLLGLPLCPFCWSFRSHTCSLGPLFFYPLLSFGSYCSSPPTVVRVGGGPVQRYKHFLKLSSWNYFPRVKWNHVDLLSG